MKSPIIFSPDGKEPKVVLAFIENEDSNVSIQIQGKGRDLLGALGMLALKLVEDTEAPKELVLFTVMEAIHIAEKGDDDND